MSNMKRMTKAQLINEVNQLNRRMTDLYNTSAPAYAERLAGQLRAKDEYIKKLEEQSQQRFENFKQEYAARMDSDRKLSLLEVTVNDLVKERDDWKDAFLKEQRLKNEARELLVRQAHLAGEVAKLVGMAGLGSSS